MICGIAAPRLKPSLRKLDRFLSDPEHGDEVRRLSEFDGFLSGIEVCPEYVRPGEGLEGIWGEDGVIVADERQANEIIGLVMGDCNDVLRRLNAPG